MTTRSTRSTQSARERMTDGDVYVFLLQIATLSWVVQNRPDKQRETQMSLGKKGGGDMTAAAASLGAGAEGSGGAGTGTSASTSTSATGGAGAASSAAAASRSDWLSLGGLADLVRDVSGSSKAARFPEKLLKRLSERLEQIAMGRDPHYRDQSLRQTVGIFYGTFKEASFQKQMKENRKVEELILVFVTSAQGALRKRMEGDAWKEELNKQVATFVKIIRECLRTIHGVSRELTDRLDGYSQKLTPPSTALDQQVSSQQQQQSSASSNGSSSTATAVADDRRGSAASSNTTFVVGTNAAGLGESSMVKTVGALFHIEPDQLVKDAEFMRKTCTEQNSMIDLKHCVKNINLQAAWPGRREDFQNDEGYQHWRTAELQALSQIMMQMCKANPELLKTSPSDTTSGPSVAPVEVKAAAEAGKEAPEAEKLAESMQEADEEAATFGGFTFIPPDPRAYYRRALEMCIDYDLEQIRYQPEDEEVSLSILSRSHIELLAECALRWRIMGPYRAVANLDVIKYKYDRGEVPLDCVSEALSSTNRVIQESGSLDWWSTSDRKLLVLTYTALFDSFMRFIHDALQDILNIEVDELQPYIGLVEELSGTGLVKEEGKLDGEEVNLQRYAEDLKDRIRIMAIHEYTAKTTDLFSQTVNNEVVPLVELLEWIEKGAKRLDKRYKEPIFGVIDPVSLLLEKQVRLYFDDLESMKAQIVEHATRERDPLAFDDIFALYSRVGTLLRMHHAFCPEVEVTFNISDWFEPHIRHWLINTEKKTTEWVNNAIASDSFVPIDSEGAVHSSSIDDLFGALQQPLDFIMSLQWPDAYRNARFLTSLAKTISRSIEQYCHRVEELFMEELFPRTAEGQDANQKQSAWMVKAKQTLQGEKKVEPFHFQASSCVKLNNIEAARLLLDKLYNRMDADEQARIVKSAAPSVPDKEQRQRFIFTVKVVLGENLQPVKDTSGSARIDSFITLSDERGYKIAKTRTIYETSDPRWDETFDIPVESQMWLAATVWDRRLVGDHNLCGRAYLRLDPRYFGDFLAHELWLDLDTQGRLLLRVSMEGEKDDILFYFGKAFRSLKRAESDMVRIIVDKMSLFIRQCLSRSVLKSLVRTSGINLDKALGNVKALYAQALAHTSSNASVIPPVDAEAPKKQRPQQLTDQEIEQAILPLLDYLDETLGTLKGSLSENEATLVLTKVWKEVLNTIDCILLPPLSDSPSDMPQLSGKEVEVVFKWLSMLRNYFNAYDEETGIAHGVPLEVLQGPKYREIVSYTLHHDANTDDLMEACVREMQLRLRQAPTKRSKTKSVLQQRSLGTIKKRKADKRNDEQQNAGNDDNLDVVLRLLRMRSGTSDFLQQQFATMGSLQAAMGRGDTAQVTPPRAQQRRMSLKYRQDRMSMSAAAQQSPQQSPSGRPNLTARMSRIAQSAALNSSSSPSQSSSSPAASARDSRQYYR